MRSGGNDFNYFLENKQQIGKFCAVYTYVYVLSRGLKGLGPLGPSWQRH